MDGPTPLDEDDPVPGPGVLDEVAPLPVPGHGRQLGPGLGQVVVDEDPGAG